MSVYHCPLCPLIFQYRDEVDRHLHQEHRSRAGDPADLGAELSAAARRLDWEHLGQLRSSAAGPSVTLLLSTAPAATMTVLDVARLRQLADRARRRLSAEPHGNEGAGIVGERLSKAVAAAESRPTDRGVAVLVNQHHLSIITLPFGPRDRQVVGRCFATRDLEYALRRYPQYRILILGHHPRILEGTAHRLAEPTSLSEADGTRGAPATGSTAYPDPDSLLGDRMDAGRLPLILIGDNRQLDRFRRHSAYVSDVVAKVARPRFRRINVPDLVGDTLDRLHHERQSAAVAELSDAGRRGETAWGVEAAWKAVHDGVAGRLWVEHDYSVPGRIAPGVCGVKITSDPAEPGVIDDVVDVLLAKASQQGIETDLLDRHTLGHAEPVVVRVPVPAPPHADSPRSLATT
ncbi:MAG TPA: hypothetical protein VLX59_09515 [Acidimicrobiales bacterium]|nr:hypothetical protein [Acidimicrobiales bacterium]